MAFYDRIPTKYFSLIPAVYFACIGSFDILSDLIDHKLTNSNLLFNLVLFLPLVVKNWRVFIVSGVLASMFAVYFMIAIFTWFVKYLNGMIFQHPFETFIIGPIFASITLLLGSSLIYSGWKLSKSHHSTKEIGA